MLSTNYGNYPFNRIVTANMTAIGIATLLLSLVVTCLGLSAQVLKNYKRKSTEGLSVFYFSVLATSYSCWVAYGTSQQDLVLIVPMGVGAVMSWCVVAQCMYYTHFNKQFRT